MHNDINNRTEAGHDANTKINVAGGHGGILTGPLSLLFLILAGLFLWVAANREMVLEFARRTLSGE